LGYKAQGTSYEFVNGQSLALDNVNFVQLTKEMDANSIFLDENGVSQVNLIFQTEEAMVRYSDEWFC
jgi:hypothetical protein